MKITREILQTKMICTTLLSIFSIYSLSRILLRRSLLRTILLIITNVSIYIFIYLNIILEKKLINRKFTYKCIKQSLIP